MKNRHLHSKKALRAALLVLLLSVVGMTKMYASYDFSAVCETGQTLYYSITNSTNHYVELTYPGTTYYDWSGYTKPTGDMVLPENVQYDGITYSVTSIGSYAFYYCSDLATIEIPNSVTYIGNYAFSNCSGLASLTVLAANPPSLLYNVFFYVNKGIPVYVPCGSVEVYTTANWGGFSNFIGLCGGTVTVAANPEEGGMVIGGGIVGADQTCTVMATANEGYAFAIWTRDGMIVSVNAEYTFYVPSDMELVAHFVPNANITFADANVKSLCVANWDTNGDGELSYAEAAAVRSLGEVFKGNTEITSFDELQYFISLSTISNMAFEDCNSLISIVLPNFVTSIGQGAFSWCTGLTSIEIPNSVTSISRWAFYECSGMTSSLIIPNSVTMIGNFAFYGCSGLTSLTIGNSVTTIGNGAFSDCSGLTSIEIPNSVTSIEGCAFYDCSSLHVVYYAGDIHQWCNIQFDDHAANPLSYAHNLYINNELVTEMVIPETVTEIKDYAFYGATCLTSLTIPNSVTSIGESAFEDCTGLTSVEIPNSVTSISDYAFSSCSSLTTIELPTSVTSIGYRAFYGCSGLTSMIILADNPPTLGYNVFSYVNKSIPVYVPCGSVEAYQNATGWNEFINIQEVCTQTQTVALIRGWNWYSTYIEQEGIDGLGQLENSIGIPRVIIQSKNNGSVESIRQNGQVVWQGTLSSINNEEMYKIATKVACNATIEGNVTTPSEHPITINRGWNSIGFPCNQSVSVNVAMSGFTPKNNDMIKGKNGYATYSNGTWSGTLNTLEPGQGYMYGSKSNATKTLVYQTGSRGEATLANITPENNYYRPTEDYADNMTLTAIVELDGEELRSDDYELAAFVGDECRGSVKLMYVEPIDRYIAFLTVFGEQEEGLRFVLTDGENMNWSDDELAFAVDGMSGTLTEPATLRFGASVQDYVNIFPNPSNGVFNIEGKGISKVSVIDAYGNVVLSKEAANDAMQIDLSGKATGVYMLQVVTGNGITTRRLIKK